MQAKLETTLFPMIPICQYDYGMLPMNLKMSMEKFQMSVSYNFFHLNIPNYNLWSINSFFQSKVLNVTVTLELVTRISWTWFFSSSKRCQHSIIWMNHLSLKDPSTGSCVLMHCCSIAKEIILNVRFQKGMGFSNSVISTIVYIQSINHNRIFSQM